MGRRLAGERIMTTTSKLMTADDLLALPRGYGRRYELMRGVLVEKMGTGDPHAMVLVWFTYALAGYVATSNYGDLRVGEPGYLLDLDPDTVRCPDLAWIAPGRILPGTQGYPNLAPDLAVEIKSPGNSNPEMTAKAWMWLSYGSQQGWVADPDHTTITIYSPGVEPLTLGEEDELNGGDLLPGFTTPVWRLFRRQR